MKSIRFSSRLRNYFHSTCQSRFIRLFEETSPLLMAQLTAEFSFCFSFVDRLIGRPRFINGKLWTLSVKEYREASETNLLVDCAFECLLS